MRARMFRFYCWPVFLFLPALTFAQVEPGNAPAPQTELIIATPVQPKPVKPELTDTTATLSGTAKTAPAIQASPEKQPTIKPATVLPAFPKPAASAVQAAPAKAINIQPAAPQQSAVVIEKSTAPLPPPKPAPLTPSIIHKPASAPHITAPVQHAKPSAPLPAKNDATIDPTHHPIDIEVFIREDCVQCDKAKEFLTKLQNLRPQLKIIIRDVRKEPAAQELLKRVAQNQGSVALDYPAFVVGGQLIIGFTEEASTAQLVLDNLSLSAQKVSQAGNDMADCETVKDLGCGLIPPEPIVKAERINFNFFGHNIPLLQIGLPLFTIVMGMLDGFNNSATWVLILLISLVAPMKNRSAIFAIAGTYIATQGIIYFIFLTLWLRLFTWTGTTVLYEVAFSAIALVAGTVYFKKYIFYGQHISITSPEITKPGIYTKIRKILQSDSLTTALLGTVAVAILVQFSELTYKSLFPALYTRVLTLQNLDSFTNFAYLILYNFSYMLDDIIILIVAMVTLKQDRMQASEDRTLKLISGLAMFSITAYLLFYLYR